MLSKATHSTAASSWTKRDAHLRALKALLLALPDWLTIHKLRGPWFIVRPKPETAKAMWQEVLASKSADAP